MKELYLFRHAKTHPAGHPRDDHARSLTPEGHAAASWIGEQLANDRRQPQIILASDAQRTLQTAELAMSRLGLDGQVMPAPELYEADVEDILALLAGRQEGSIMIVGHNPGIEEIAGNLTGSFGHMRPGFCLWLCFDIDDWEELYGHPAPVAHHLYRPPAED